MQRITEPVFCTKAIRKQRRRSVSIPTFTSSLRTLGGRRSDHEAVLRVGYAYLLNVGSSGSAFVRQERRLARSPTISLGAGVRVPYPAPSGTRAQRVMQVNRKRDTSPEIALRSASHRRGLRFRKDVVINVGRRPIRVDVVLARYRKAGFVDGCFWHSCPKHGTTPQSNTTYWHVKLARNIESDQTMTDLLETDGWRVIRVWENEDPFATADVIHRRVHSNA